MDRPKPGPGGLVGAVQRLEVPSGSAAADRREARIPGAVQGSRPHDPASSPRPDRPPADTRQRGMIVIKRYFINSDKIHTQIQENKLKEPKKQGKFQRKLQEVMEQAEAQKAKDKKK